MAADPQPEPDDEDEEFESFDWVFDDRARATSDSHERTTVSFNDRMHTESQQVYDRITAAEVQAADVEAALLDAQLKASTDDD